MSNAICYTFLYGKVPLTLSPTIVDGTALKAQYQFNVARVGNDIIF
jgi:hypothetical protein